MGTLSTVRLSVYYSLWTQSSDHQRQPIRGSGDFRNPRRGFPPVSAMDLGRCDVPKQGTSYERGAMYKFDTLIWLWESRVGKAWLFWLPLLRFVGIILASTWVTARFWIALYQWIQYGHFGFTLLRTLYFCLGSPHLRPQNYKEYISYQSSRGAQETGSVGWKSQNSPEATVTRNFI